MTINELVQKAAARDDEAWKRFVEAYSPLVWRLLRQFHQLGAAEQEDLFQDVFVALLNGGLARFRGSTEHELRWYLKTITGNEAKSYLRRSSRRREVLDPFFTDDEDDQVAAGRSSAIADPSPGPEELVRVQEMQRELCCCLEQIESGDQEIFWMRQRGISYKQITEQLALPQGTVASKYYRAKAKIEECLKKAGIVKEGAAGK